LQYAMRMRGTLQKRNFVLNITFVTGRSGALMVRAVIPPMRIRITNSAYREHSFVPALRQLRPRLRSGRKAKTMRVAAISTDQLVPCPTCGGFMRLSDAQAFECKQCGRAIRVEGILKTIDGGE